MAGKPSNSERVCRELARVKLQDLSDRYAKLSALLSEADTVLDQDLFRSCSKEYVKLEPIVKCFHEYQKVQKNLEDIKTLMDSDPLTPEASSLRPYANLCW